MTKNHPPGHTWQTSLRRAVAAAIALGAAGVFSIVITESTEASAQSYYGQKQRAPDRVIFRNPTYYGPNTAPANQNADTRNPASYRAENPQARARNTDDYGVENYQDGNLDTNNLGPSNDPNVYTNPTLNNQANVVPQVTITPAANPNQNERNCLWTDGNWYPESMRVDSFSSLADEKQLYCDGDNPYPPYCWAMGFGVCSPAAYLPSSYGYYGDGGYGLGPNTIADDAAYERAQGGGMAEPQVEQPTISITPANQAPEPSGMGAGPPGP